MTNTYASDEQELAELVEDYLAGRLSGVQVDRAQRLAHRVSRRTGIPAGELLRGDS